MARWIAGIVVNNKFWTEQLYSLQIKADHVPFEAGQFGRLALDIDGNQVGRPYSFVNAPHEELLEFYSIVVPEGPLSPRLASLQPGDTVWVSPKGAGFFTLSEVPESRYLWMLSTGTALGPFLSILKTDAPWKRFKKITLAHAVRTAEELTYQDTITDLQQSHPGQFSMAPFVSRETTDFALQGRIPAAISDGRLEECAGMPLNAKESHVMICGNPEMVSDTCDILMERGLTRNKRREPGQISTENYW